MAAENGPENTVPASNVSETLPPPVPAVAKVDASLYLANEIQAALRGNQMLSTFGQKVPDEMRTRYLGQLKSKIFSPRQRRRFHLYRCFEIRLLR